MPRGYVIRRARPADEFEEDGVLIDGVTSRRFSPENVGVAGERVMVRVDAEGDDEGDDRPGTGTVAIGPVGAAPVDGAGGGTESLLARGAEALFGDGDLSSSRALFEAAYAEAERTGDINGIAVATLGLGGSCWPSGTTSRSPSWSARSR